MNLKAFEERMSSSTAERLNNEWDTIFLCYHEQDSFNGFKHACSLYGKTKNLNEKSFLLHTICVFLERLYDTELLSKWSSKWTTLIAFDESDFTKTAHLFHSAVKSYFECQYNDAEIHFKKILKSTSILRFQSLSHYHLGLIYKNRNFFKESEIQFKKALKVAETINNQSLSLRIQKQMSHLNNKNAYSYLNLELRDLIENKDTKLARIKYLELRRKEILNGIRRDRNSLHAFLPIFAALKKKWSLTYKLLELISDANIKAQTVGYILKIENAPFEMRRTEKHLLNCLSVNVLSEQKSLDKMISDLNSPSSSSASLKYIQELSNLLTKSNLVSKDEICRHVWGIEYDPLHHDNKIYKLIHEFRTHFGIKDIIINCYGHYQLNNIYKIS